MDYTLNSTSIPTSSDQSFLSFTLTYTSTILIVTAITLYLAYYCYFYNILFEIKGKYDTKNKHIGKVLPPYPNGWYVA